MIELVVIQVRSIQVSQYAKNALRFAFIYLSIYLSTYLFTGIIYPLFLHTYCSNSMVICRLSADLSTGVYYTGSSLTG